MTLLDRLIPTPRKALHPVPLASKAVFGAGVTAAYSGVPMSSYYADDLTKTRNALRMMKTAQDAYIANRHIRKVERAIFQRFAKIAWHLEDATGIEVGTGEGQNDDPAYLEPLNLLQRPYTPGLRDPRLASPRTYAGLAGITCRHMGLCGPGYWFLDQIDAGAGTPKQLLYINPARMTPAADKMNGKLHGWVLDADEWYSSGSSQGKGTPLDIEDVVTFALEEPDRGFLPVGLVASALSLIDITRQTDMHASSTISSGGRLSGLVGPKGEDIIPPEIYEQLKTDLRNVAEDPQAAKRMAVMRAPVDFNRTSATFQELELTQLMQLTGEEVAELWGIPQSQLGAKGEGGLNSGETKGYDEAIIYQGPIAGRLGPFKETIQYELLDRWKAKGVDVTIVFEEPEFDDETPAYDRASKAQPLPLTNDERRAIVGEDPLEDEELGAAVWMPSSLVQVWPPAQNAPTDSTVLPGSESPEDVMSDDELAVGDLLFEEEEEEVLV